MAGARAHLVKIFACSKLVQKASSGASQDPGAQVDHTFALGKMPDASAELSEALTAEQSSHKDLSVLDCLENCLNSGKTFLMFLRLYYMVRV